jgi:hypothetical protein
LVEEMLDAALLATQVIEKNCPNDAQRNPVLSTVPIHVGDTNDLVGREIIDLPRQRRLPREVLRLRDIIASNGSIE